MQAISSNLSNTAGNSLGSAANHGAGSEPLGGVAKPGQDKVQMEPVKESEFRAIMERHLNEGVAPASTIPQGKHSLGERMIERASDLSGEMKKDQQYISQQLEQATRAGDSMQLMKAMTALSDYQTRVQFIAKAASKAVSSVDQLTKLQ